MPIQCSPMEMGLEGLGGRRWWGMVSSDGPRTGGPFLLGEAQRRSGLTDSIRVLLC